MLTLNHRLQPREEEIAAKVIDGEAIMIAASDVRPITFSPWRNGNVLPAISRTQVASASAPSTRSVVAKT